MNRVMLRNLWTELKFRMLIQMKKLELKEFKMMMKLQKEELRILEAAIIIYI